MTICAGNLAQEVTEDDLRNVFRAYGQVSFVNLIKDRFHKTPAGFAMIVMPVQLEAQAAILGLHMKDLKGQPLKVNEAGIRPPVTTMPA